MICVNKVLDLATEQENLTESTGLADTLSLTTEEKAREWNRRYQVGTKVKSTFVDKENLETRTKAFILFGHRAVVYNTFEHPGH